MSETKTPHPYADVIKAWAEGHTIQFKTKNSFWYDLNHNYPHFAEDMEWRIKPVDQEVPHHKYREGKWFDFELNKWFENEEQPNYFEQFKIICKGIADGKVIQYRQKNNDEWIDHTFDESYRLLFSFNFNHFDYRIKPKSQTIRYQCYLYNKTDVLTWASNDIDSRECIENDDLFLNWIGDEQSITIEVDDE